MLAIPALPTENLNKFLALGGILAALATIILCVSELQKTEIDNVKLQASYNLYDMKIQLHNKDIDRARRAFLRDSLFYNSEIKNAITLETRQGKEGSKEIIVYKNKQYSPDNYHALMSSNYEELVVKYNEQSLKKEEAGDIYEINLVKLKEQSALIGVNNKYINVIGLATCIVVVLSLSLSIYGFYQWYILQKMSDNIIRVQLAKSEKELEDLNNKDSGKNKIII